MASRRSTRHSRRRCLGFATGAKLRRPTLRMGHSEDISWPRSRIARSRRNASLNDDIGEANAASPVSHAGRDPRGRAARIRSVPAEPGQGHEPSLARPGGGRRRLRRRHAARRSFVLHLSRPRPHAGARRADREGAGRTDAARQRPDARQGRLDASDLGRSRRHGLLRHHRRASADRLRRGLARAIQGPEGRLGLLLRRRHHQYRRLSRGAEFRRGVEAAGDLHLREQSLHGIYADRRRHRRARIRRPTAPRPMACRASSSTATTPTPSIAPRARLTTRRAPATARR